MGCLQSKTVEQAASREIESRMQIARDEDRKISKLLLLGPGGSGKSTFFKQMQIIHGRGFTDDERSRYAEQIHFQIIHNLQTLLTHCKKLLENNPDEYSKLKLSPEAQLCGDAVENATKDNAITPELKAQIKTLWADEGMQEAYRLRALFGVDDTISYFCDQIDRVGDDTFLPTNKDIVMNRYMTIGMTEQHFEIRKSEFVIVDVGGQRSERRKWIKFFNGVTAVIFITSLSAFDENLFEDTRKNSMQESLEVFEDVWKEKTFNNTPILLFLNKYDVFDEKIRNGGSIKNVFPDFDGPDCDPDASRDYIVQYYKDKYQDTGSFHRLYVHITTATDPQNVERVFVNVQEIVVKQALNVFV